MLGRSVAVQPNDYRVRFNSNQPITEQVIERLDDRSEGPHPMQDEAFPFRVRMTVDGQERAGVFRGNDYIVPIRAGEVYALEIENRGSHHDLVLMRLLVDGLNTLPQPVETKGVQTMAWGSRVNLENARPWKLIRGRGLKQQQGEVFKVPGFYSHIEGTKSQYHEFKVVDAAQSLAAQQEYTGDIGLITAAFYARGAATRAVGTAAGERRKDDVRQIEDVPVGKMLGVVHIRYVDADAAVVAQQP